MKLLILTKQEINAFLWILGISLFGLISLFQANTLYLVNSTIRLQKIKASKTETKSRFINYLCGG